MDQENNVFDEAYVGQPTTIPGGDKKSLLKNFLKTPVPAEDITKYGTSKPKRTVIRATIKHGKG